jgi:hypothetical protein
MVGIYHQLYPANERPQTSQPADVRRHIAEEGLIVSNSVFAKATWEPFYVVMQFGRPGLIDESKKCFEALKPESTIDEFAYCHAFDYAAHRIDDGFSGVASQSRDQYLGKSAAVVRVVKALKIAYRDEDAGLQMIVGAWEDRMDEAFRQSGDLFKHHLEHNIPIEKHPLDGVQSHSKN